MQLFRLDAVEDEDVGGREWTRFFRFESAAAETSRRLNSQGWLTDFYSVDLPELGESEQHLLCSHAWLNSPLSAILQELSKKTVEHRLQQIAAARRPR